jgi:hypothetical protein
LTPHPQDAESSSGSPTSVGRSVAWAGPSYVAAAPAALLVALPSALRLSSGAPELFASWVIVAGLLAIPLLLATILASAARITLAACALSTLGRVAVATGLALAVALPIDAALAAALKAHTHHRALGGATFAVAALAVYVVVWALSYRVAVLASGPSLGRRAVSAGALREGGAAVVAVTLALGSVAALAVPIGGIASLRPRAFLLDLALSAAVVAAGTSIRRSHSATRRGAWRSAAAVAGAVAVIGLVVAAALLLGTARARALDMDAQAPVAAAFARAAGLRE